MTSYDLVGQRFGRLVVIAPASNKGRRRRWHCACDCGGTSIAHTQDLTFGKHRSCGCLHVDAITKHGRSRSPEYRTWTHMKQRCLNPKATHFERYGGRGIQVCPRWRDSFGAFLADLGERPSPAHTLDRIDNDGHYEPGNVRWATRWEQAQNRHHNPRSVEGRPRNPKTGRFSKSAA